MPLLFVHGVNNRTSDCGYFRDMGMRREMFDRLVVPAVRGRCPEFAILDEAYWGDLGVKYNWGLRSVPATNVLKSLTPGVGTLGPAEPVNAELLALLEEFPAHADDACSSRRCGRARSETNAGASRLGRTTGPGAADQGDHGPRQGPGGSAPAGARERA